MGAIQSEMSHIAALKDELLNLADANGKVADKDKARAEFILGRLSEALGEEYTLTGNQIQNYKDLAAEIDNIIAKKKAQLLLEANEGAYTTALQNKAQAEKDYYTNLESYQNAHVQYLQEYAKWQDLIDQKNAAIREGDRVLANELEYRIAGQKYHLDTAKKVLKETETAYNNSKNTIIGYHNDIGQYETASVLALQGNTAEAQKVLADREYYHQKYADSVGFAHDEVINTWELEAIEAGVKAALIRKNWENGVEGYTEEMVTEAETNYQKTLDAMGGAYDDAAKVGGDVSNGLKAGMEGGRGGLIQKAKSIVQSIMSAFRKEADSHSPSRKMIDFGEDMGEGAVIGLDNKTDDLIGTARGQVRDMMDAFNYSLEQTQAATQRSAHYAQAAAGNLGGTSAAAAVGVTDPAMLKKLDGIYERLGRLQMVTDTGKLVGEIIDKVDARLAERERLIGRGVII